MAKIGFYKTEVCNPKGTGKLYSVRMVPYSVIDSEEVVELACKDSNINRQDLAVGVAALCQAIENFVLQGHSVTLAGLGNFRLTAKTGKWDEENKKWVSAGSESMDGVSTDNIRGVYLRFRPCTALRNELKNISMFDVTKTLFGGTMGGYDYTTVGK